MENSFYDIISEKLGMMGQLTYRGRLIIIGTSRNSVNKPLVKLYLLYERV